jgi:hypothetical protein
MTAPPPHPDLGRLAALVGEWEGEGTGVLEDRQFSYREVVRFWHTGKPFLGYEQLTWAEEDGRPLHTESGYWRAAPDGTVEVVLAHAIGDAEIEVGRWDGDVLRLATLALHQTPTAKRVTRLERDLRLERGRLSYELRMARDGGPARPHLRAALRPRAAASAGGQVDSATGPRGAPARPM